MYFQDTLITILDVRNRADKFSMKSPINIADLYAKVVETTAEGIACVGADGEIAFTNEAFCRLVGYDKSELLNYKMTDLLTPDAKAEFLSRKEKRAAGELKDQYEMVMIHKSGKLIYTLCCVSPIRDDSNRFLFSLGVITDITAIKLMQIENSKSIAKLKKAQAVAGLGFWEHDILTNEFWISDELHEMLNVEVPGDGVVDLSKFFAKIHPDDLPRLQAFKERAYKFGANYNIDYRICRTESEVIYVNSIAEVEKDKNGRTVRLHGIVQNITERVRQENTIQDQRAKMQASAKLSALGEMAGGVAHEINTPLAIIQMRTEQLLEASAAGEMDAEMLAETLQVIGQTTVRIAKIINGLRTFSRHGDHDPFVRTSVKEIVETTLSFCNEKFKNNDVTIDCRTVDAHLAIDCQQTQVCQVLLNLLNNSFDAIQGLKDRWIRIEALETASSVDIVVADSGAGIPKEIAEKIFQPFFTTKPVGLGTGIGLSISIGLMASQKGSLFIDDKVPNTCFVMRFPKSQARIKAS